MTEDTNTPAEEIQDQDLDQAQGGVIINGDHRTIGRISANESSRVVGDQVMMGGSDPFNTADRQWAEDSIDDATDWVGSVPTPHP